MKRITILLATILGLVCVTVALAETGNELFEKALSKERVDGDLKGAIQLYQKVVDKYGKDRALAARALLGMAESERRLGNAGARKLYERVVKDYADQKEAAAQAKAQLGVGSGGESGTGLVCTYCGSSDASMSADGRWVAFTDARSGDIAVRDLRTGQARLLPAKTALLPRPMLSPDAKQVAYLGEVQARAAATGATTIILGQQKNGAVVGPLGGPQLQVISTVAGATPRVVAPVPGKVVGWSADGKSLLVLAWNDPQKPALEFEWIAVEDGAVRSVKKVDDLSLLTEDMTLSPDGRYLAYTKGEDKSTYIHVFQTNGTSDLAVVQTAGENHAPVWSADGKRLLYLSNQTGKTSLWSVPMANGKAAGEPAMVAANLGDGQVEPLGMTASGAYYYNFEQEGVTQITIVPLDAGGRKIAGPVQTGLVGGWPTWSPDGKLLAFLRHHPGVEQGPNRGVNPYDLVIRSMATGQEKTFPTPMGNYIGEVNWFQDSKSVLTRLMRDGKFVGGFRVNVETGEFQQMFEGRLSDNNSPIMLSRDDKTLYIFRGGVVARDLATGEEKQILSAAGGRLVPVLSPDGSKWAISRRDFAAQRHFFGIADANGMNIRELYVPEFDRRFEHVNWTPDGKTILFHQSRAEDKDRISTASTFFGDFLGPRQVMRLSVNGGPPEYTGIEVDGWMMGVNISPDGKRGAYSWVKPVSELRSLNIGVLK